MVREPGGEEPWLYLKPLFMAELGVARSIRKLREGRHPLPAIDIEAALDWVEKKMGLQLAVTQRDAIRAATREKVLIVTGGPGVGKTTIVRGILEIFAAQGAALRLCAPTGRAAKRLTRDDRPRGEDDSSFARVRSRFRRLQARRRAAAGPRSARRGRDVDGGRGADAPAAAGGAAHACVVLVGDVDQLPSVGPGLVLADLIESKAVPVVRLTEIFRQAGQSWIVRAAHAIKHGECRSRRRPAQGDFYFVEANTPEASSSASSRWCASASRLASASIRSATCRC